MKNLLFITCYHFLKGCDAWANESLKGHPAKLQNPFIAHITVDFPSVASLSKYRVNVRIFPLTCSEEDEKMKQIFLQQSLCKETY